MIPDPSPRRRSPNRDLRGRERRLLRSLAHSLSPVVQIGKEGVSDALVAAVDEALESHELIKIRVLESCPEDRKVLAPALVARLGAHLAGALGRVLIVYRRHPERPRLPL